MIPTFPAPSAATLALRIGRATASYASESTTVLADGTRVQLSWRAAWQHLQAIQNGMPVLPVAVSDAGPDRNFVFLNPIKEHAWQMNHNPRYAAPILNPERFAAEESTGTCDFCGGEGRGLLHFSPDAMLRPTPGFFRCGTCLAQEV